MKKWRYFALTRVLSTHSSDLDRTQLLACSCHPPCRRPRSDGQRVQNPPFRGPMTGRWRADKARSPPAAPCWSAPLLPSTDDERAVGVKWILSACTPAMPHCWHWVMRMLPVAMQVAAHEYCLTACYWWNPPWLFVCYVIFRTWLTGSTHRAPVSTRVVLLLLFRLPFSLLFIVSSHLRFLWYSYWTPWF